MAATTKKPNKPSLLVTVSSLGLVGLLIYHAWQATLLVDLQIAQLPVGGQRITGAQEAKVQEASTESLKLLYPLQVESNLKADKLQMGPEGTGAIDKAFDEGLPDKASSKKGEKGSKPDALPEPPPMVTVWPDYFKELKQAIRLDGLTKAGAILNGKHYAVGEALTAYPYPDKKGKTHYPVLRAVTGSQALVGEDAGSRTHTLALD